MADNDSVSDDVLETIKTLWLLKSCDVLREVNRKDYPQLIKSTNVGSMVFISELVKNYGDPDFVERIINVFRKFSFSSNTLFQILITLKPLNPQATFNGKFTNSVQFYSDVNSELCSITMYRDVPTLNQMTFGTVDGISKLIDLLNWISQTDVITSTYGAHTFPRSNGKWLIFSDHFYERLDDNTVRFAKYHVITDTITEALNALFEHSAILASFHSDIYVEEDKITHY